MSDTVRQPPELESLDVTDETWGAKAIASSGVDGRGIAALILLAVKHRLEMRRSPRSRRPALGGRLGVDACPAGLMSLGAPSDARARATAEAMGMTG
jgi:hypothetical protein